MGYLFVLIIHLGNLFMPGAHSRLFMKKSPNYVPCIRHRYHQSVIDASLIAHLCNDLTLGPTNALIDLNPINSTPISATEISVTGVKTQHAWTNRCCFHSINRAPFTDSRIHCLPHMYRRCMAEYEAFAKCLPQADLEFNEKGPRDTPRLFERWEGN